MDQFNNSIPNEKTATRSVSYRRFGKQEYNKFVNIKFKRSTDFKTLILGMVITLVLVLPIILILVQLFTAFMYMLSLRVLFICIAWGILLVCNGSSSYFMVVLAKHYFPEEPKLINIDAKAIFFYQTFNFGFMAVTLTLIIILIFGSLS